MHFFFFFLIDYRPRRRRLQPRVLHLLRHEDDLRPPHPQAGPQVQAAGQKDLQAGDVACGFIESRWANRPLSCSEKSVKSARLAADGEGCIILHRNIRFF